VNDTISVFQANFVIALLCVHKVENRVMPVELPSRSVAGPLYIFTEVAPSTLFHDDTPRCTLT